MKTEDDIWQSFQTLRPYSAYTGAFLYVDIGADNVRGTAEDQTLTLYGVPTADLSRDPATDRIIDTGEYSRYRTVEASISRRYGNGWSVHAGASHVWLRDGEPRGLVGRSRSGRGHSSFRSRPRSRPPLDPLPFVLPTCTSDF